MNHNKKIDTFIYCLLKQVNDVFLLFFVSRGYIVQSRKRMDFLRISSPISPQKRLDV